jgi:hypothetical protein
MRTLAVQAGPEKLALVVILSMLAGCGESEAPDNEVNPLRTHAITRVLPATEAITGANIRNRCINLGRIARSGSSRIRSRVSVQAPSLCG